MKYDYHGLLQDQANEARLRESHLTFEDIVSDILLEAMSIIVNRQKEYGPDNISAQGAFGVYSRIRFDKLNRIARQFNGEIVDGEVRLDFPPQDYAGYEDAILDVIGYSVILMMLNRGLWNAPLEEAVKENGIES